VVECSPDVGDVGGNGFQIMMQSGMGYALHVGVLQSASQATDHKINFRIAFRVLIIGKALKISLQLIQ
jgi:hypothetical protein